MARQTIRERFAAWLCRPFVQECVNLSRATRTILESHERVMGNQQKQIEGLELLCEGLAADLNSTLGEIRSQQAEESNKPRVRVARNWTAFSEAATLAAQKGASNGKHIR